MWNLPVFVDKTGQGSDGRAITVYSDVVPKSNNIAYPMFDGFIKLPPPNAGDIVLLYSQDTSNTKLWYLPIRYIFSSITDNSANIQIESPGGIDLDGTLIKIGANATEAAVKGDVLKSVLNDALTAMGSITVATAVGNSSIPLNIANINAIIAQLISFLSQKVKIE